MRPPRRRHPPRPPRCRRPPQPPRCRRPMRPPAPPPSARSSQRDRRQAAERKILDAAVSILIERGYAATSTLEVQKLAGVSRGVLLHYYGSRSELIAAATRHLYATRIGEVRLKV